MDAEVECIPNTSLKSCYYRVKKSDFGVRFSNAKEVQCRNKRTLRFVSVVRSTE